MMADAEQLSRKLRREFDAKPEVWSRAYNVLNRIPMLATLILSSVTCLFSKITSE